MYESSPERIKGSSMVLGQVVQPLISEVYKQAVHVHEAENAREISRVVSHRPEMQSLAGAGSKERVGHSSSEPIQIGSTPDLSGNYLRHPALDNTVAGVPSLACRHPDSWQCSPGRRQHPQATGASDGGPHCCDCAIR